MSRTAQPETFRFPFRINVCTEFASPQELVERLQEQAQTRSLPKMYEEHHESYEGEYWLKCQLCTACIKLMRIRDKWYPVTIRVDHHHPKQIPLKMEMVATKLENEKEMNFEYPTTIIRGRLFQTKDAIWEALADEARDRNLPVGLYKTKYRTTGLVAICKVCGSRLNFVKRKDLFEATTINPWHIHQNMHYDRYQKCKLEQNEQPRNKEKRREAKPKRPREAKAQERDYSETDNTAEEEVLKHTLKKNYPQELIKEEQPESELLQTLQSHGYDYKPVQDKDGQAVIFVSPVMKENYENYAYGKLLNFQLFYNMLSGKGKIGLFWAVNDKNSELLVGVVFLFGNIDMGRVMECFYAIHQQKLPSDTMGIKEPSSQLAPIKASPPTEVRGPPYAGDRYCNNLSLADHINSLASLEPEEYRKVIALLAGEMRTAGTTCDILDRLFKDIESAKAAEQARKLAVIKEERLRDAHRQNCGRMLLMLQSICPKKLTEVQFAKTVLTIEKQLQQQAQTRTDVEKTISRNKEMGQFSQEFSQAQSGIHSYAVASEKIPQISVEPKRER